jgi:Ribbon-helix-helix protein, copG family
LAATKLPFWHALHAMKKISVYLSDREVRRLGLLARREGISQAEVIRRAISAYPPSRTISSEFSIARSGEGPGDSVADLGDEELTGGFGS